MKTQKNSKIKKKLNLRHLLKRKEKREEEIEIQRKIISKTVETKRDAQNYEK